MIACRISTVTASQAEAVVHAALITQIQVLTKRIAELEAEVNRRRLRQMDLRVAVNNLHSFAPEGHQRDRLKSLLDAENDQ